MRQIGDLWTSLIFVLCIEAMLYRMRVGCPWRDLPARIWKAGIQYQKLTANPKTQISQNISTFCAYDPDLEWAFIDGYNVSGPHHHSRRCENRQPKICWRKYNENSYGCLDAYGLPIEQFDLSARCMPQQGRPRINCTASFG